MSYMYSIRVQRGRKPTFLKRSMKNWITTIAIIT